MEKVKPQPELVIQLTTGLSKAVPGKGGHRPCLQAFPSEMLQGDRCTINELSIYTANKQEIIDGFKYLHGMQASG